MGAQVANDLKVLVCRFVPDVHGEIAKCRHTLSNRLSTIKSASAETVPSAKSRVCNETSEDGRWGFQGPFGRPLVICTL